MDGGFKTNTVAATIEHLEDECSKGRAADEVISKTQFNVSFWQRALMDEFLAIAQSPFDLAVKRSFEKRPWGRRLYRFEITAPAEYVLEWLKIVHTKIP